MRFAVACLLLVACGDPAPAPVDGGTDAPAPMTDAGPPVAEPFTNLPTGAMGSEGIALAHTETGDPVLVVGTRDDRLVRITPDGTVSDWVTIQSPVGIAVRADGETILACAVDEAAGTPAIFEITSAGVVSLLVATGPAEAFGLTNFVLEAPDGSIVFTDSMADRVFRADADGANVALVADGISYANGMAFSPDGATLYVASWDTSDVYALSFDEATGAYGTPAIVHSGIDTVDGIVTTSTGSLVLVTSNSDIVEIDPDVATGSTLVSPSRLIALSANGVFGDDTFGRTELYVTSLAAPYVYVVHTGLMAP